MKKCIGIIVVVCIAGMLSACGGKSEPAPETLEIPLPSPPPASLENTPAPVVAPPAEMASVSAVENTPAQPAAVVPPQTGDIPNGNASLAGTKWQVSDFTITFQDEKTALLEGGPLVSFYPNGVEANYACENGKFALTLMGKPKEGTWDGSELIISGVTGKRLP